MPSIQTTTPKASMSLLHYTMITLDDMIDQGLDKLENSEIPIVQQMNRRVDEIQDVMKHSMQIPRLMTFMSMSVMLPIVGITLFMFGGSPLLTGALAMAAPLSLMSFMRDNTITRESSRYFINGENG